MKKFEELSEPAKKVALENHRHDLVENGDWHDLTIEEWKEKLEEFGYEGVDIGYTGFWSQGDGASFEYTGIDLSNSLVIAWMFSGINQEIAEKIINGQRNGEYDCDATGKRSGRYMHENSISHYLTFNLFDDEVKICGSQEGFNKVESKIEENLKKFQVELSKKLYKELEDEYEGSTTDESVIEEIDARDCEFNDDGTDYTETEDDENEFDEKTTKPIDLFEPQDLVDRYINLTSDERIIKGAQIVDVDDLGNEFEITFETQDVGVASEKFKDTFVISNEDMNFLLENGTINFDDMGTETELDLVWSNKFDF